MAVKEPLTNVTAWAIYANALDLLAMTFWLTLLFGISAALLVVALTGDPAAATTLGLVVSGFTWPIMFGMRASRIRRWAGK